MTIILTIILLMLIAVCIYLFRTNQRLSKELLSSSSEKSELIGKLNYITSALTEKQHELISLRERIELLSQENVRCATLYQEIVNNRNALKAEFSNLSQEILENKQEKFSTVAKKEVGSLISDLQKEFLTFKNEIFSPETKSRTELATNLKVLFSNIEKMHMDAENLTNALKNNSKAQGDWGEIQLENLLQQAGLQEDSDYIKQGKGLHLSTETNVAKPDFLVRLPREQWILIDAKVSLTAYERLISETNPQQQDIYLSQHIISLKKHIDEVAKYHNIQNSIDICPFLLMFLPIEAAYTYTINFSNKYSHEITEYARKKNVIIVYPSTLFLTLRLIQTIWQVEKQNINAQQIAERGGKLYDKFSGLLDELRELYKLFGKVNDQFNEKIVPKINGRGGLLMQCDELQKLGTKNKKFIKSEQELLC